jgi:hypothetical protein
MFKVSFSGRLAIFAGLVLALSLAASSLLIAQRSKSALVRDANGTLDTGMVMLRSLIEQRGGGARLVASEGKLMAGSAILDGDTAIVDAVKRATGGTATLFSGDLRIATSVMNKDGVRGTGTLPGDRGGGRVDDSGLLGAPRVGGNRGDPCSVALGRHAGNLAVHPWVCGTR